MSAWRLGGSGDICYTSTPHRFSWRLGFPDPAPKGGTLYHYHLFNGTGRALQLTCRRVEPGLECSMPESSPGDLFQPICMRLQGLYIAGHSQHIAPANTITSPICPEPAANPTPTNPTCSTTTTILGGTIATSKAMSSGPSPNTSSSTLQAREVPACPRVMRDHIWRKHGRSGIPPLTLMGRVGRLWPSSWVWVRPGGPYGGPAAQCDTRRRPGVRRSGIEEAKVGCQVVLRVGQPRPPLPRSL